IVAVHGLGGDAHRTWTGDKGKLWLRDFLPATLGNARVFTYGYDAVVAFSKSSAEVDDFARDLLQRVKAARSPAADHGRPLFFICHSLGGLVVKQALNIAHGDAHMATWLKGVVFMGTPHAGSGVAFWASLAGTLLSTASLGTSTNKDLLKLLCSDSAFLDNLSRKFAAENPQLPILSFYELEKFPFLNRRVRLQPGPSTPASPNP
ncbi:Alpha/Beta hydrolase protein, partial [Lasiosphaeria miniovina]